MVEPRGEAALIFFVLSAYGFLFHMDCGWINISNSPDRINNKERIHMNMIEEYAFQCRD